MEIIHEIDSQDWEEELSDKIKVGAIDAFESGKIILLPKLTFELLPNEKVFFSTKFSDPKFKNISYDPRTENIRGAKCNNHDYIDIRTMMVRYVKCTHALINQLFPVYRASIQLGRTSFRPIEIMSRIPKSYRKDDSRLHVDAFPMSPTQGRRIIRVFTNINPNGKDRVWRFGEPFIDVASRFLPQLRRPWIGRSFLLKMLGLTKSYCTEYDYMMLQLHNKMKADMEYQKKLSQCEIRFLPHSSWIVQTDQVSHAAMSGQYALEQTFYLPVESMILPQYSPLRILEKLTGRKLAEHLRTKP